MYQGIVVSGMGIISSIGKNIEDFEKSLKEGYCGIGSLDYLEDTGVSVTIGAQIKDFDFESISRHHIENMEGYETVILNSKKYTRRSPYPVQCSVLSALEAWSQAKLSDIPSEKVGLIVAGNNLTQNLQYQLHNRFQQVPEYLTPTYAIQYMDTDQLGTISEIFKIHGEGFTVGGASASGNVGLIKGYQLIKMGIVDACMVVGSMAELSPMEIQGFYNIGAMGGKVFNNQPEKACRPFDEKHEGFIYGQASACIILESVESAQKRNAPFLAEMMGGAVVLDGNRLTNPNEKGEAESMKIALNNSGIDIDKVDYINAHGSSSPLGDETEIKAIKKVFGERISEIWINSTKGLTGHCLYSAGVVEAIASIIQMKEGFIHGNINLDRPIDDKCKFSKIKSSQAYSQITLSNSFGFGGINTSIILKNISS